jgi:four helix bundle protein
MEEWWIMPAIGRFEDIQAWQKARVLTVYVYRTTSEGSWSRDFGLRDQVRRAAVSVMSNIAEGFARRGDNEFHRFLCISRGSAAEVESQLYVALDLGYINRELFQEIYEQAEEVSRMVVGLMKYLKK